MKTEFYIEGPNTAALMAAFMPQFYEARKLDFIQMNTPVGGGYSEPVDASSSEETPAVAANDEASTQEPVKPKSRMYGEASPGKSRRNKAEIEQDKRIEEMWQMVRGNDTIPEAMPADAFEADLKERVETNGLAITETPEDRQDPAQPAVDYTALRQELIGVLKKLLAANEGEMPKTMEQFKTLTGYDAQSKVPDDELETVTAKLLTALPAEEQDFG